MTESKTSVSQRENLDAEKYFYYVQIARQAIDTAVEQGLWVAVMADMLAMSGRVERKSFLGEQRANLHTLMDTLTSKTMMDGFLGVGAVPNPGYYIFRWLRPLGNELGKTEYDEGGVQWYKAMDPIPRMLLVFVFPGALKLLAAQLGEILPG